MPPNGAPRLSKEQKTGFALLLVFALLAVSLGFLQFRVNIYAPFALARTADTAEGQVRALLADDSIRLQQIDTDQDGFNDYEELTYYETSPYLKDTDSDGVSDKDEIDKGTDPNCAEGKQCDANSRDGVPSVSSTVAAEALVKDSISPLDVLGAAIGSATSSAGAPTGTFDINAIMNNPSVIRQLLISQGSMTAEQLSQIDDATLLELVKQTIAEQDQESAPEEAGAGASTP